MIGYHYTTWEHWEEIQKTGLKPSIVHKMELEFELRRNKMSLEPFGVWVWQFKQSGISHLGNLVRVLAVHKSPKVVVLAIEFKDEDIFKIGERRLLMPHNGVIGEWRYHTGEPAFLLKDTVPIERITLEQSYNLAEMVKW